MDRIWNITKSLFLFCYRQCSTMDPGPHDDADEGRSNKSLKIVNEGVVLEGPPIEPRSVKVSSTGSLLIMCHKQLLFKLYVKGGCNRLVGSTVL